MLGKAASTAIVERASSLESDADNSTPNTISSAEESAAEDEFVFCRRSHKMSSNNPFAFGMGAGSSPSKLSSDGDEDAPVVVLCRAAAASIGGVARDLQRLQAVERRKKSTLLARLNSDNGYSSCESVEDSNTVSVAVTATTEEEERVDMQKVSSLLEGMLLALRDLRERVLDELPVHVGDRLVEEAERMAAPQDETTLLLGRCFNFSMNLKILSQSASTVGVRATLDETLAARLLCDLEVLQRSLERRTNVAPEATVEATAEAEVSQLLRDAVVFQRGKRPALLKLSAN